MKLLRTKRHMTSAACPRRGCKGHLHEHEGRSLHCDTCDTEAPPLVLLGFTVGTQIRHTLRVFKSARQGK